MSIKKRWTNEEDMKLLDLILTEIKRGTSIRESVKVASESVDDRNFESCYARWNNFLRIEHEDRLEESKNLAKEDGKIFYEKWTIEDDELLTDLVLGEISNGKSVRRSIDKVAKRMNRSFASCYHRWQSVLSNNYEQQIIPRGNTPEKENNLFKRVSQLEESVEDIKKKNDQLVSILNEMIGKR